MNQNYYNKLIKKIDIVLDTKELDENEIIRFNQYRFMLEDDVLDLDSKHHIAILLEDELSNVRDFPLKVKIGNTNRHL